MLTEKKANEKKKILEEAMDALKVPEAEREKYRKESNIMI